MLKSERNDDRIPVLLIQRSIEPPAQSSETEAPRLTTTTSLHGWTLIVPQGWGMPFFSSLTYTGTRTGDNHCKLTAHLVAGKGMVCREFFRILDDVQVWEGGLDHDDVGAFGYVARLGWVRGRVVRLGK